MFPHKKIHLHTWTSPVGHHHNQIDHVAINGQYKRSINDDRAHRGADVGSDHNLVVIKIRLKLCKIGKKPSTSKRYETCKLKVPEINQRFRMELKNRFGVLANENSNELEESWEKFKDIYNQTASTVLGPRKKRNQDRISADSWKEVEKRRSLKEKIDGTRSERVKERLREEYRNTDKNVKKSMRRDKRQWLYRLADEAETSANDGNMKGVYHIAKLLSNERPKQIDSVKDKNGKVLTNENGVRKRWKEHFCEGLNRPNPSEPAEIDNNQIEELDIDVTPPTKEEIRWALRNMKNRKADGIDNISADILKADLETSTDQISKILDLVWIRENVPSDWRKGLIIKLAKKGDLTCCGNWRGITLIPNITKIMGKIFIKRISKEVDKHLRDEQGLEQ